MRYQYKPIVASMVAMSIGAFLNAFSQPELKFSRLSIDEGLSQNTVLAVLQDQTGFTWVGTEDGLNRYDGYEFVHYKHDPNDRNSITNNQINTLYEDMEGRIWIGTAGGLDVYYPKNQRFITVDAANEPIAPKARFVTSVLQDNKNRIWVGTFDGLKWYDPWRNILVPYIPWKHDDKAMFRERTRALFEDRDHRLWVGVGNTVHVIDLWTGQLLETPAALRDHPNWGGSFVRTISQDEHGNFWIGTEGEGIFFYNDRTHECYNYRHDPDDPQTLASNLIRDILPVADDELWIGTREGLSVLDSRSGHCANFTYDNNDPQSLGHNSVRCLLLDKAGSVWVGTTNGGLAIRHLSNTNFLSITERTDAGKDGLSQRVVSDMVSDGGDGLWIGTEGGGLNHWDRRTHTFRAYLINDNVNSQQNNIKSMYEDGDGKLWIGSYDGLCVFDPSTERIRPVGLHPAQRNTQIYALAGDDHGIWIGTNGGGLSYLDRQTNEINTYVHSAEDENSISENNITALLDDGDGLWIGTERGGLNHYHKTNERFTRFYASPGTVDNIGSNAILALYKDSKQRLWIGTRGGGLSLYNSQSGSFCNIDARFGLDDGIVHAILEDDNGAIWISTNTGLYKIVLPGDTLPRQPADISIKNYNAADGLQSNQFTSGALKDGEVLYFASIKGISYLRPDEIVDNRFEPRVVLTDFMIRNKSAEIAGEKHAILKQSITSTSHITLRYHQASFSLRYAALNYIRAGKNRYAYRLEGLKGADNWQYVDGQRMATYTNLSAGTYTFSVKATNNDGVWSPKTASISITVLPPLWKTWWAYTVYILAIAALLYAYYYYSIKTATLKSRLAFEQQSHEKDQELVRRRMNFFITMSHEIKTPLTLILAPLEKLLRLTDGNDEMRRQLTFMNRNGKRLNRLVNQLLDVRKMKTGEVKLQAAEENIVAFLKEIVTTFQSYANHRNTQLVFHSSCNHIPLWFDWDKMEKILYNLLSNAFKFTPEGGRIAVSVGVQGGHVVIDVEDNGVGIEPDNIAHIFDLFYHCDDKSGTNIEGTGVGLAFSKALMELHHGEITVKSECKALYGSSFTAFTLKMPTGNAHLKRHEMVAQGDDNETVENRQYIGAEAISLPKPKDAVLSSPGGNRLVMMIVEDNPEMLDFIASHFRPHFNVKTATDGMKGWEMATALVPDIIISDVMMPKMNGTTLCNKLKSDDRTSHIPILLLTARAAPVFRIEGLETGADDYVTKPFDLRLLETRVWNLLDSRIKLRERYRRAITMQPLDLSVASPDEMFLRKTKQYVEANMANPALTVEDMGQHVGMSRVTLYRKIKAMTNQSAIEFIRHLRLNRAAQLLKTNTFYVNEVVYMVGFTDVDYFRKCFKDQFGYTPKEYAQSNGKEKQTTTGPQPVSTG